MLVLLAESPEFTVLGCERGKVYAMSCGRNECAIQPLLSDWPEVVYLPADYDSDSYDIAETLGGSSAVVELEWREGECEGMRYKLRCGYTMGVWVVGELIVL